jgi:nicotinamidase/pyrazinamidase
MQIALGPADALIVVDMQKDFMPGGALAVAGGDALVPLVNRLTEKFRTRVFSRDWHPANHVSFSDKPEFKDFSWPPHCVQNTPGAEFHPELDLTRADRIVDKAFLPNRESYSAFDYSDLTDWLQARGVQRVFVCGLATDYCVKATALDAVKAGFQSFVILDAARAVSMPEGSNAAVAAMRARGVEMIFSHELVP